MPAPMGLDAARIAEVRAKFSAMTEATVAERGFDAGDAACSARMAVDDVVAALGCLDAGDFGGFIARCAMASAHADEVHAAHYGLAPWQQARPATALVPGETVGQMARRITGAARLAA